MNNIKIVKLEFKTGEFDLVLSDSMISKKLESSGLGLLALLN